MAKFVNTFEKPLPHIGLPDWYAKQWELQRSADVRKTESLQLRNMGRTVRIETDVRTRWNTYMNNVRLENRMTELSNWRNVLNDLLQRLLSEMHVLNDEKIKAEREIENIDHPLKVVNECISMRDSRRETELTHDEVDSELKKELHTIADFQDSLTKKIQIAWEKLNHLENIKFELSTDIEDKDETIRIDEENLKFDRTCANISYKPEISTAEKTCLITYELWLDRCRRIKALTDKELSDCYNFYEAMRVARECAWNDIRAQQDTTDYVLRKRIYQTQKARNEFEWQKLKIQKEMEALKKEIGHSEEALSSKTDTVKCAETRLEKRNYRPGFELCKDQVDSGLRSEVLQLKQTEEELIKAIECLKASYNSLESLLIRIDKNLEDKQHSLNADVICLDMRLTLKTSDRMRLPNETNRNIVLTRMEKEIPTES